MARRSMTIDDLSEAWNAEVDAWNQWDSLGLDEIVAFAQKMERESCAAALDASADRSV